MDSTERQLIKKSIDGNRRAQSALYNYYAQRMMGVCLRYARNREEAEEILQEGFLRVFENLRQFKATGSFEGWIRKIIVHAAFKKYRTKLYLHPLVENLSGDWVNEFPVHPEILSKIGQKELLLLVQMLPPRYRLVFNLYVFEGMKHREIAKMVGISEGTSKSNLADARTILRKRICEMSPLVKSNG